MQRGEMRSQSHQLLKMFHLLYTVSTVHCVCVCCTVCTVCAVHGVLCILCIVCTVYCVCCAWCILCTVFIVHWAIKGWFYCVTYFSLASMSPLTYTSISQCISIEIPCVPKSYRGFNKTVAVVTYPHNTNSNSFLKMIIITIHAHKLHLNIIFET